ncbi:MAG: aminoglycoside phosphotransferase family protein [Iamia sp.]
MTAPTAPPSIAALATAFGLDATGATVVRTASRHVVRFPASEVRTFAVPAGAEGPRTEATVASVLADAGVPAARVRGGPTSIDGWSVTAWHEIPGVDPDAAVDAATLGALASQLHTATARVDGTALAPCDPVAAGRAQLRLVEGAAAEVAVLRRAADRLEPSWHAAADRARPAAFDDLDGGSVLHGDLHHGNVVVGRDGPVLVDLELAGWGPRAFDAAPTAAFVRWYGRPATDLAAFDGAYGAPLGDRVAELGLDEVWALWSACWGLANRHRSAAAAEESDVRVATVATGHAPRPWRLR